MRNKHYFAPGAITGYKARNAKHLAKWAWRVVAVLLVMSFASGLLRGCMSASTHKAQKQVTT